MGMFRNIYEDFRQILGFESTLDSLERKINFTRKEEEDSLKRQQLSENKKIDEMNYQMLDSKNELALLDKIIVNIQKIKDSAREDIQKYSSGMEGKVSYYQGNYSSLCIWLETLSHSLSPHLYVDYKRQIDDVFEELVGRYIDVVLRSGLQDNGELAENENINYLFHLVLMDAQDVSLSSSLQNYQYLEDIRRQAERRRRVLSLAIHQVELQKRPHERTKLQVDYQMSQIERERVALRNTREYIEAQRQKERMKRG